jgi:hypothetical protein
MYGDVLALAPAAVWSTEGPAVVVGPAPAPTVEAADGAGDGVEVEYGEGGEEPRLPRLAWATGWCEHAATPPIATNNRRKVAPPPRRSPSIRVDPDT